MGWSVGGYGKSLLGACGCLLLAAGCVSEPRDAAERLAKLKQDGEALNRAADTIEERLMGNQANLHVWQELAERHKHVSAIATMNSNEHLLAMVKMLDKQQEKARKLKRSRVASERYFSGAVASNRPQPRRRN